MASRKTDFLCTLRRFPLMALHFFTWYRHKMSCRHESPNRKFTLFDVPRWEIHSGTKHHNSIISMGNNHTFSVKSVCRYTATGSACVMFATLNNTCIFSPWSVYLQIARYEMSWSFSKRDTKSKSHCSMKLVPVRVFSCKHPLSPKTPTMQAYIIILYLQKANFWLWFDNIVNYFVKMTNY